jgi:hypothetical protein
LGREAVTSMAPFTFCPVCRANHDKGKGHRYGVKHKQYLGEFLSKARSKVQDIRVSLMEVTLLQDDGRGRTKFWCAFCEQEVDEEESTFNQYVGLYLFHNLETNAFVTILGFESIVVEH